MNSEKEKKEQRKAFVNTVKDLIDIATSNPFCGDEVAITLPRIPGMNSENIKPAFKRALGYVPEILYYHDTVVSIPDSTEKLPVTLVIVKLEDS